MRTLTIPHGRQCKALLDNEEALSQLRGRKFRTLIHEVFDMCGLGMFIGFDMLLVPLLQL